MIGTIAPWLLADGPDPALAAPLATYGRFVGAWRAENRWYEEAAGAWRTNVREIRFGWALGGRAIQDVWGSEAEGGYGTTIRSYDAASDSWRVVFHAPHAGIFCALIGRADPDGIHQEGVQQDGRPIRWLFREITPETFTWLGQISDDEGATWRLEQEMRAERVSRDPAAAV